MNRILLLILIAGITFLIILFISRPELFRDVWLWIVGLAGPIVKVADVMIQKIKNVFTAHLPGKTKQETAYYEQQTKNIDESVG